MKENILTIETVHQCNKCLGCKTLHPLVSVINLSEANPEQQALKFDFYTILLLEGQPEDFLYGRKSCDYSNASLLFLTPGESLRIDEHQPLPRKGWLLAFHPHLICGTTLGMNIDSYTFFSYQDKESLHLSLREKTKAIECLRNIEEELLHAIDRHSKTVISRHIELLLDYCTRFYERQFITRSDANKKLLHQLDLLLDKYIRSGKSENNRLPSAKYCSTMLHLSPAYFNDLLKFETGKTIELYFELKRMEVARSMLIEKKGNVSQVARQLGFPSVQYFSKLFQKMTGKAPGEYRINQN